MPSPALIKPVVLLDVDGVISDFDSAFLKVYEHITGIKLSPKFINKYDVMSYLTEDKKIKKKIKRIIDSPGWCSDIKPYPGAVKVVRQLMKDCDLFIVTAPTYENPTWTHEREHWLMHYFGKNIRTIHTKHKYKIQGDIFLDDKTENLQEWSFYNKGIAVVWDKLYNKDYLGLRITSWQEFFVIIDNWRLKNERT